MDEYGANFVIFLFALFQTIGISWVYGLRNISNDFEFMTGSPINLYVLLCWGIVIPVMMIIIFFAFLLQHEFPPEFELVPKGMQDILPEEKILFCNNI